MIDILLESLTETHQLFRMEEKRTLLDHPLSGLTMMTFLTAMFGLATAYWLGGPFGYALLVLFGVSVLYFLVQRRTIERQRGSFPALNIPFDEKRGSLYKFLFIVELVLLGVANDMLESTDVYDFYPAIVVLLVGLHLILLANSFDRKSGLYAGSFISLVALAGMLVVHPEGPGNDWVNGVVTFCGGSATALAGLRMIRISRDIIDRAHGLKD